MCLNCGCGVPDDNMGNPDNITTKDLAKAQLANPGMSSEETLKSMEETLKKVKPKDIDKEVEKLAGN